MSGTLIKKGAARSDAEATPRPKSRKSTARLLWAAFSVFVVYGTTFPFKFNLNWKAFLWETRRINWLPLGGVPGDPIYSDIIQNILLFMPFGFLGYFSLVYKSSWLRKAGIVLAGASLSTSVEFLQIFSPARWPALSDVIFNTVGTAVGLAVGIALKKSVLGFKSNPIARRFLDAPSAYPALIFLVLTVAGCWEPFDFTLDPGIVWSHIKPLLHHPLRLSRPDDDLICFIRFLLTALFTSRLAFEAGLRRPVLAGTALVAALGVSLEASQAIIQSRMPETQDALVAVMGSLCGGIVFFFPGFHRRPRVWTAVGGLVIFLSAASHGLYPYRFSPHYSGFNWVLFQPQYQRTTFAALGDFIEDGMTFFPVGFLLGYFFPHRNMAGAAALLAGAMAFAVEAAQGFAPGRYADVTDVLGAVLGAVAGGLAMTRGWPSFKEYMREDQDAQV